MNLLDQFNILQYALRIYKSNKDESVNKIFIKFYLVYRALQAY